MDQAESPKRILVVDDENNLCRALDLYLTQAGYQVATAQTVSQALSAVEAAPPNLLLLDIRMPEGSGYDICEAVRNDPKNKDIRILMMSALCRDIAIEKALSMGADDYLRKPFDIAELKRRIEVLTGAGVS